VVSWVTATLIFAQWPEFAHGNRGEIVMLTTMFSGLFTNVTTEHNLEHPQLNLPLSRQSVLRRLAFVLVVALSLVLFLALR
jgi:hypothetical protein